ncbi:MAG: PAS domain S-box protein [Deltaproteobacteria bacterium]|nr:MAG: PAS domain S-box protein [Deltaproteobacteria bacterium]
MTKAAATRSDGSAALADALLGFFTSADTPAAICDPDRRILAANHAFGVRIGARSDAALVGETIDALLTVEGEEGPNADVGPGPVQVPVVLPGGGRAMATFKVAGELTLVTLDAGLEGARLARAMRALSDQQRVFSVGRLLSLLMVEEDLVGVVAQGLRDLFPGRFFAVRVVDPKSMALTSLYSEGPLRPEERDYLTLKRSAVTKTRLPAEILDSDRVRVRSGYHPIFEGTERGIGVPLVAGNQLFGMLNVEGGEAQFDDIESDERLLIALANHLSVALRNAKLIGEARYLRGYLEKIIDHANALIVVADRKGRITVFNRAFQAFSGFSRDAVVGRQLVELVPPEERQRISRLLSMALRGRTAENVEVTVLSSDGRRVRAAFNTASIPGPDGGIESVIAIGTDLTRMVELERQVIQAEKLASLGQLAAAVVHELNNPLTSITVYADYLKERLREAGQAKEMERAGRILEAAGRIQRFTRSLVDYARPSEERHVPLDLREVIEQSLDLCEHVVTRRNVQVVTEWSDDLPQIQGNRGKLQQVFVNLVTNACQAMDEGGRLTIRGRVEDEAVRLEVEDDGHGMPPEIAERIFEPFFSTKAPGKGTGLGLSIVQGIVESHGGEIRVESELDRGTTFVLSFPLRPRA